MKMGRMSRVSTQFPSLLAKLRSCPVRLPVEAAVDSLVHPVVPHHFATGMVAPSTTTEFSTASWKNGAKRVVFPRDYLCQAAIFLVRNASRVWRGQTCSLHGIASLCYWNG
jgi:hypothetical protein